MAWALPVCPSAVLSSQPSVGTAFSRHSLQLAQPSVGTWYVLGPGVTEPAGAITYAGADAQTCDGDVGCVTAEGTLAEC